MTRSPLDESYASVVQSLSPEGLTAKALRPLRPCLSRVSIGTHGKWVCREVLRQSVTADSSPCVEEILDIWPPISLSCAQSVLPPKPRRGYLVTLASMHARKLQIRAFHLFGQSIAQKLQEGEIETRDWFFTGKS